MIEYSLHPPLCNERNSLHLRQPRGWCGELLLLPQIYIDSIQAFWWWRLCKPKKRFAMSYNFELNDLLQNMSWNRWAQKLVCYNKQKRTISERKLIIDIILNTLSVRKCLFTTFYLNASKLTLLESFFCFCLSYNYDAPFKHLCRKPDEGKKIPYPVHFHYCDSWHLVHAGLSWSKLTDGCWYLWLAFSSRPLL